MVLIMFAGKAWCYVCPWDAIAGWMEKLRFWKKTDEGLGLDLKWPRAIPQHPAWRRFCSSG